MFHGLKIIILNELLKHEYMKNGIPKGDMTLIYTFFKLS